jgi:hypothetical protein
MLEYGMRQAKLKVCMFPAGEKQVPGIRVAGEWLKACGFQPGDQVVLGAYAGEIRISRVASVIAERKADEMSKTIL